MCGNLPLRTQTVRRNDQFGKLLLAKVVVLPHDANDSLWRGRQELRIQREKYQQEQVDTNRNQ